MSGKTVGTTCKRLLMERLEAFGQRLCCVSSAILVLAFGLGVISSGNEPAIAADSTPTDPNPSLTPDAEPLDLRALEPGNTPAYVVTATRISLTQLSVPSLWWLQEQIANEDAYGSNFLENWLAYPNNGNRPGRVDLVVNRQSWSLLDYLDRYAFIHTFGKAARDYGYDMRVFDGQATLLGASTCDFSTINIDALQTRQLAGRSSAFDRPDASPTMPLPSQPVDTIACSILLDSSGKSGLRGGSNRLLPGGGGAKGLGTGQP